MQNNPYRPPTSALIGDQLDDDRNDAERIRTDHIKHEAAVRSIGTLYWIGGVGNILVGLGMMLGSSGATAGLAIALGIGTLCILIGSGIRKLRRWTRIPVTIFGVLGLLMIPVGTFINAYVLYLIYCEKGKTVFAPEYQEIMRATPHVKHKTSKIVWVFLILLVGVFVFAIIGSMVL